MATKKNDTAAATEPNDTAMAVTNEPKQIVANSNMVSTIVGSTIEAQATVYNALNNAMSLKDAKDAVLDIEDIIMVPGIRKGRNGMPDTECTNTYLIDIEGNAWFTQSDGIARSAQGLVTMFFQTGMVTKQNPLHIKVVERELNNGNTIKSLVLDM